MAPFSGKLVDKTGQRIPLVISAFALFIGYYGLHVAYIQGWDHSAPILCLFSLLTGVGSSLGNSAALNACAKSYPHNRGSATAFPIAAYGLSAFLFSRISYGVFPGDTGSFLLVLAVACGSCLLLCSFLIGVYGPKQSVSVGVNARKSSDSEASERGELLGDARDSDQECVDELEAEVLAEITGVELLKSRDFHLMIVTVAFCKSRKVRFGVEPHTNIRLTVSGFGLMYINNLGNNLTALFRAEHAEEVVTTAMAATTRRNEDVFPQSELEALQALNVSLLSIFNCGGRIFAGMVSDLLKHRINLERSSFLFLSGCAFMVSAAFMYTTHQSALVARYTALLGFAYGNMFGIAPVLTSELFGLHHFSTNWGILSVAPGVSGNIFNLMYGRLYDLKSDPATHTCALGLECFRDAYAYAGVGTGYVHHRLRFILLPL